MRFPGDARFAFSVFDDTDVATVENVTPVYRLLEQLGLRTTKTVWPLPCPETAHDSDFRSSQTLADRAYRDFVVDLQRRGFEIASHGATMESSPRDRTLAGLDLLRATFGAVPRLHANHAYNRENLYWGTARLDDPILKRLYARFTGRPQDHYQGDVEGSPYWWGDRCRGEISYVRNLTFSTLNLTRVNPTMPYHDPSRPLVRWWFSATDAEDAAEFVARFTTAAVDRLEHEGGVCILATHFGKGYAERGSVLPAVRRCFEDLARRAGWFPPVGELLDWLRSERAAAGAGDRLPAGEWRRMQWRWARDLIARQVRRRLA